MDTKGGKLWWGGDGGVLNWVIGIDMYTLMCIKLMINKNLKYKKTNKTTNAKKKEDASLDKVVIPISHSSSPKLIPIHDHLMI